MALYFGLDCEPATQRRNSDAHRTCDMRMTICQEIRDRVMHFSAHRRGHHSEQVGVDRVLEMHGS